MITPDEQNELRSELDKCYDRLEKNLSVQREFTEKSYLALKSSIYEMEQTLNAIMERTQNDD